MPALYARIVNHVTRQVDRGELRPGDWLPPIRDLAAEHGASETTVKAALRILRERRLVEGTPGGGTWVAGASPSTPAPRRRRRSKES